MRSRRFQSVNTAASVWTQPESNCNKRPASATRGAGRRPDRRGGFGGGRREGAVIRTRELPTPHQPCSPYREETVCPLLHESHPRGLASQLRTLSRSHVVPRNLTAGRISVCEISSSSGGARGRLHAWPPGAGLRSQPGIGQFDGPLGPQSRPEPGRQGNRVQSRLAGRRHPRCRA